LSSTICLRLEGGQSTGISHSAPCIGTTALQDAGPHARLSAFALLCRVMPRPCISVKPASRLLRQLRRATFLCRISAQQARSRMHCHEGMHLLSGDSSRPALGANHIFPLIQSIIGTLSPRHTRHPMHETAIYPFSRYRYL
jgi:hypothetical protein